MESLILRYGLSLLTIILILLWYYLPLDFLNAKSKFQRAVNENPFGDYEQPRMAQTLGVFGTFLGITIGLLSFDPSPENMQHSVTNLLGGMTTAFLTSILGMWLSFCMKRYQEKLQLKISDGGKVSGEETVADLIQYLKRSDAEKARLLKDTVSTPIEKLTNSLVGDGDDTIIGQIKFIRLEMRDNFFTMTDTLRQNNLQIISELQNFGRTLAESNSKVFIEALNETMKDFNNKLTEQFGDNFKQLNIAVGKLLEWQIHYMETLETVTRNLETAFAGIDAAKNSIAAIEQSAAEMYSISTAISDLMVTANLYEKQLEQVLKEIQSLGESAAEAVPKIVDLVETSCSETQRHAEQSVQIANSHLTQTTDNLAAKISETMNNTERVASRIEDVSNSSLNLISDTTGKTMTSIAEISAQATQSVNFHVEAVVEKLSGNLQNVAYSAESMAKNIQKVGNSALKHMVDTTNKTIASMSQVADRIETTSYKQRNIMDTEVQATTDAVKNAAAALRQSSFKITEDISNELHKMMNDTNAKMKTDVENHHNELNKAMTESLNSFGKTMDVILNKFAKDYMPLVMKLREIVELAERIERRR